MNEKNRDFISALKKAGVEFPVILYAKPMERAAVAIAKEYTNAGDTTCNIRECDPEWMKSHPQFIQLLDPEKKIQPHIIDYVKMRFSAKGWNPEKAFTDEERNTN